MEDEKKTDAIIIAQAGTRLIKENPSAAPTIINLPNYKKQISKEVVKAKLRKKRHLILSELISPSYLESIFPSITSSFQPQIVTYNGGVGKIPKWKISCYLEVMKHGVPTTNPCYELRDVCWDLLESCNKLFRFWYYQQHACKFEELRVKRIMTFITRYTPNPGEQALLKHIDGAGKVDGSLVVALPTEKPIEIYSHFGHGGGLTFWDGKGSQETFYDTHIGDVAFIDRAVWHQANPITKGTRWALVIFYEVL